MDFTFQNGKLGYIRSEGIPLKSEKMLSLEFVSALSPAHFKQLEGSLYVEVDDILNKRKDSNCT